jgi:DNA mismatch repair protein MutS2
MTGHALDVLEFERVLERIAARASSEAGKLRVLALRPRTSADVVVIELDRVAAVMRFVDAAPTGAPGSVFDVSDDLAMLAAAGAVLDASAIYRVGRLLGASRGLALEMTRHDGTYPELESIRAALVEEPQLEVAIDRCVDEDGNVLSTASPELKAIRDRLRGARSKIVRRLEKFLGTVSERHVVPDASVTIRDGRFVIPVRREGRGEVGGIVHDESQSGATLYIEPPLAIEATNQLRELERDEAREVRRVLAAMTGRLAPLQPCLAEAFEALTDFDSLHARARAATSWNATAPSVTGNAPGLLVLRDARHPLLVEAAEGPVVPYDLTLEPEERCLVVSGPNTGGKSVFLKATGLIAALAQSGVVPPVGPGTQLPVFGSFFADIGDEQSIARNLSTFSAHLANLSALVSAADERSLVLVDEMGTGTDPAEGAALARAVLEELVTRGATTIVSSHLGELKQLDSEGSGIVNASLQFDAERMEPTYRLLKGRPGRSYGLAIARRLGFPGRVIDRAEEYREQGAAQMEDILERLEAGEAEVERLLDALEVERRQTERLRTDLEQRSSTLREAERTSEERARSDARKLLLEARAEVERTIEDLREAAAAGAVLDDAARDARRKVEVAAGDLRADPGTRPESGGGVALDVRVGARVRIRATGAKGHVNEVRGDRAVVEVGALRLEVPVADLETVDALPDSTTAPSRGGGWSGPPRGQASIEVDLRGLRVDELEGALQRALDGAILEDLPDLRIIHGKGTGALRQRVSQVLEADARVLDFRIGGPSEGGAGVTVATFRGAP